MTTWQLLGVQRAVAGLLGARSRGPPAIGSRRRPWLSGDARVADETPR